MNRAYNFSAGPSMLPTTVLERVNGELLDYQGTGMSIMEMSHRWNFFEEIYHQSIERLRRIARVPDSFDVLYMTGGASMQFALVPMNLRTAGGRAGYIHTGVWSKKAIEQAKIQGADVYIAGSSESRGFDHVVMNPEMDEPLDYLHITSNNTIYGTTYHRWPDMDGKVPLAIDMSSDFLSRPMNFEDAGIIYAGMQKNAGPSGATVVLIRKDLYERESETTPSLLRYSTYATSDSMYNTPPTFQIYVFNYILDWIEKEMGGLEGIHLHNQKKAAILYDYLDSHPHFFKCHAQKESRSLMNVTFNLPEESLEKELVELANGAHLWGLKGHRSIGGLRASIYNAMPASGVEALVEFLDDFRKKKG